MKPRVPTGLVVTILVAFACCATSYLIAPPAPPKVALVIGPTWHLDGTNIIVNVDLANLGGTGVEFDSQVWELLVDTPTGWKIIQSPFASISGGWIAPGAAKTFSVPVPIDAKDWMLSARYRFYRRRDSHHRLLKWVENSDLCELAPDFANRMKRRYSALRQVAPTEGVVKTDFFTNLPPVLPWPPQ